MGSQSFNEKFCSPKRFCDRKVGPNDPKVHPKIGELTKNDPKKPPDCKRKSKSQAFSEPGLADCAMRL